MLPQHSSTLQNSRLAKTIYGLIIGKLVVHRSHASVANIKQMLYAYPFVEGQDLCGQTKLSSDVSLVTTFKASVTSPL